jgi:arylsulfatase
LIGGTYVNVVHLPSITSPVTLAANVALAASTAVVWLATARSVRAARIARSRIAALSLATFAVVGTSIAARGWKDASTVAASAGAGDRPNVFVIVIDTLRFDRTGLADEARSQTVNLDRLAGDGTAYERAYAQASWTKPSVASLFTSLYPSSHGANLRRDRLAAEPTTVAEVFARRGYRTAVFSANPWVSPAFGFDRGVDYFYESEHETYSRLVMLLRLLRAADRVLPGDVLRTAIRDMEEAYGLRQKRSTNCERDDAIVDAFRTWLDESEEQPAFAYFHLMSPHIPYEPPAPTQAFAAADQVALLQQTDALTTERRKVLLSLYDQAVVYADAVLGEIVAILRERNALDDSLLIVTADHGEEFHEHGHWGHGKSLFDEVLRVPLVLRGPGIPAGVVAAGPAMLIDVLPTVVALTGATADASWEGRSLAERIPDRPIYAELLREGGLESYMLYHQGRKYVETVDGLGEAPRHELFDLRTDPAERRPQTTIPTQWAGRLAAVRNAAQSKRASSGEVVIDEAAQEKLEALGYFN